MSDTKLSTIETILVILTIFVAHSIVSMPKYLLLLTNSATLINLIYIGIIIFFIAYIIYKLLKNFPGSDIVDISDYIGGKTLKNIMGSIFIFYFMTSSAILIRKFCESIKVVYYPLTNVIFIVLAFIITICITNKFEFATTAKVNLIVLPIAIFSILFLFGANVKYFQATNIFPIFGKGIFNTFVTGLGNLGAFGGISLLYFTPPFIKEPSKTKKIFLISVGLSILYIILCVGIILFMFPFLMKVGEIIPLYSVARYVEFGSFFQRLESLFLLIWILEIACYLSITTSLSLSIFKKLTNIKNTKPIVYIFALLTFSIAMFPKNYAISQFIESTIHRYFSIGITFILGISILIIGNIKKRKKKVGENHV